MDNDDRSYAAGISCMQHSAELHTVPLFHLYIENQIRDPCHTTIYEKIKFTFTKI
jgi:hypothetical protein